MMTKISSIFDQAIIIIVMLALGLGVVTLFRTPTQKSTRWDGGTVDACNAQDGMVEPDRVAVDD